MEDLSWAEHGHCRVGARRRPGTEVTDIVVTQTKDGKAHRIIFEGPDLVVVPMDENVTIDWEDESMLSFGKGAEGAVRDMFFALAKLLGMSTDAEEAYARGKLEGENRVLWSWARSAATQTSTPTPSDG